MKDHEIRPESTSRMPRRRFLQGPLLLTAGSALLAACAPAAAPAPTANQPHLRQLRPPRQPAAAKPTEAAKPAQAAPGRRSGGDTIKVGVLHSLSGTMAISETSVRDATLLAIDEINAAGGVLGKKIEPVVEDGASDWPTFAEKSKKLISAATRSPWCSAAGPPPAARPCCRSSRASRACSSTRSQYEGLESSPEHLLHGRHHQPADRPGGRLPDRTGADEDVPARLRLRLPAHGQQASSRRSSKAKGGELAGEEYTPLGHTDYATVITKIKAAKPDVVFNTLNGDSNVAFFKQLKDAGITADKMPTLSVCDRRGRGARHRRRRTCWTTSSAWNYFQTTNTPENKKFVDGATRRSTAPTASPTTRSRPATSASTSGRWRSRRPAPSTSTRSSDGGQGISSSTAPGGKVTVDDEEPAHLEDGPHRQDPRRRPDRRGLELRQAGPARSVPRRATTGRRSLKKGR